MINNLPTLLSIILFLVINVGCKDSVKDQNKEPVNYPSLTNEHRSPDAAEVVYDAASGIFGSWGTDMNDSAAIIILFLKAEHGKKRMPGR